MTRHLMMHLYPHPCGKWRRSVAHLLARWPIFTGRRIVAVALDDCTDTLDDVRAAFGWAEVEFLPVKNSHRQEVVSLGKTLAMLADEPGITFRCHSKGCTHPSDAAASHLWADAIFESCLDYPPLVECALQVSHVCGAFRSTQPVGHPAHSPAWHFAGSCFWFRNDELFRRDWRQIDNVLWGAESYPGWKFGIHESTCLFFDHAETGHLYDPQFWAQAITPGLRFWRNALKRCGLSASCANPPVVSGRSCISLNP